MNMIPGGRMAPQYYNYHSNYFNTTCLLILNYYDTPIPLLPPSLSRLTPQRQQVTPKVLAEYSKTKTLFPMRNIKGSRSDPVRMDARRPT